STDWSILDHWIWTKRLVRSSPRAIRPATSTSKPRTCDGSAGSASTNGAPPSASPPQRSTCDVGRCTERVLKRHSARLTNAHKHGVELKPMQATLINGKKLAVALQWP